MEQTVSRSPLWGVLPTLLSSAVLTVAWWKEWWEEHFPAIYCSCRIGSRRYGVLFFVIGLGLCILGFVIALTASLSRGNPTEGRPVYVWRWDDWIGVLVTITGILLWAGGWLLSYTLFHGTPIG